MGPLVLSVRLQKDGRNEWNWLPVNLVLQQSLSTFPSSTMYVLHILTGVLALKTGLSLSLLCMTAVDTLIILLRSKLLCTAAGHGVPFHGASVPATPQGSVLPAQPYLSFLCTIAQRLSTVPIPLLLPCTFQLKCVSCPTGVRLSHVSCTQGAAHAVWSPALL